MNEKAVILIVDDEVHTVNALKRALHRMDHEILSATSPEDAISIINHCKIDIIICDYNMPKINGIDVLKHSRKVMPAAVRVLMTGCSDVKIAISAINEGSVFYYMSKPWTTEELTSMIRRALEKRRSREDRADLYQAPDDVEGCSDVKAGKTGSVDKKRESDKQKIPLFDEDDNILLVNSSDILYLAAESGEVTVAAAGREYKSHESLNAWSLKLDMSKFFRCHRSYIVNIDKIEKISPWFNGTFNLMLKDCKETIPVSRENMKTLRSIFGL